MVRLISRQRGGLAALKLTKLFGIDDFPAAKDSGKVLIIIIYCYLIIIIPWGNNFWQVVDKNYKKQGALALFHDTGTFPIWKDRLKSGVKGYDNSPAHSLTTLADMPSTPVDFVLSSFYHLSLEYWVSSVFVWVINQV